MSFSKMAVGNADAFVPLEQPKQQTAIILLSITENDLFANNLIEYSSNGHNLKGVRVCAMLLSMVSFSQKISHRKFWSLTIEYFDILERNSFIVE